MYEQVNNYYCNWMDFSYNNFSKYFILARVAQLAEHVIRNDEVVGSTPIAGFYY